MAYAYSGPIGASVNGFAAFLSGAASYFIPISLSDIIAESTFINKLNTLNQLEVFIETYGSISLNVKHLKMLNQDTQKGAQASDVADDFKLLLPLFINQILILRKKRYKNII